MFPFSTEVLSTLRPSVEDPAQDGNHCETEERLQRQQGFTETYKCQGSAGTTSPELRQLTSLWCWEGKCTGQYELGVSAVAAEDGEWIWGSFSFTHPSPLPKKDKNEVFLHRIPWSHSFLKMPPLHVTVIRSPLTTIICKDINEC